MSAPIVTFKLYADGKQRPGVSGFKNWKKARNYCINHREKNQIGFIVSAGETSLTYKFDELTNSQAIHDPRIQEHSRTGRRLPQTH